MLSYFAAAESKRISERTKAGLKRAQMKGKRIGRPNKYEKHKDEVRKLRKEGLSIAKIGKQLGIAQNIS